MHLNHKKKKAIGQNFGITLLTHIWIRIKMSFIRLVCLHIQGICYGDRSSTVQQNDSIRTGHSQQKNNMQIGNVKNSENTIYNTDNYVWGLTCKLKWNNKCVCWCHGAARGSRNEETRIITNRVLMNDERRRYRNTWKDVTIYRYLDINNNPQETWGRTDYI